VPPEPSEKRTIAFIDGQNLFYAAKTAFGYSYPNYDPLKLAEAVVSGQSSWSLTGTYFYTGVPDPQDSQFWNVFWSRKLAVLGTRGVKIFTRARRHGKEKGIDVRLALDVVRLARQREFDVALIFSQDQDLSEAADEVRAISIEQQRWIKVASAYPSSVSTANQRGIDRTDWIQIDKATYDACIDPLDYRSPLHNQP